MLQRPLRRFCLITLIAILAAPGCLRQASPALKADLGATIREVAAALLARDADRAIVWLDAAVVERFERLRKAALDASEDALAQSDTIDRLMVREVRRMLPPERLRAMSGTDLLREQIRGGWLWHRNLAAIFPEPLELGQLALDYVLVEEPEARGRPGDPWDGRPPVWFHFVRGSDGRWRWRIELLLDRLKGLRGADLDSWTLRPGVTGNPETVFLDLVQQAARGAAPAELQAARDRMVEPPPQP